MTLVFEDPESKSLVGIAAFSHAMSMASELPCIINENYGSIVRIACIESWFSNMRLLCEFFGIGGSGRNSDKDYKAEQFAPVFIDQNAKDDLEYLWYLASKLVTHISKDRHNLIVAENFEFSAEFMERSVSHIIEISRNWAKNLKDLNSNVEPLVTSAIKLSINVLNEAKRDSRKSN